MAGEEGTRFFGVEEEVGRKDSSPHHVLRLSVSRVLPDPDIIAEVSQSQESAGRSPYRRANRGLSATRSDIDQSDRVSVTPTVGSPNEPRPKEARRVSVYQIRYPTKVDDQRRSGRSHTSSPSPLNYEGNESLLSSEAISSVAKRKREQDGDSEKAGSSYALTPKDSDQSSFDSHTFSQLADDSSKRRLKQRLNIPKTTPSKELRSLEGIDSQRSAVRQDDYLKDYASYPAMFSDEDIKLTFEEIDLDHNGFLSAAEVRTVIDSIGEYATDEEIEEMIKMLDVEGRGQVNFDEFYKMATGQTVGPGGIPPSPSMKVSGTSDSLSRKSGNQSRSHRSGDSKRMSNVSKHSTDSRLNVTQHARKGTADTQRHETSIQKSIPTGEDTSLRPMKSFEIQAKPHQRGSVRTLNVESAGRFSKRGSEQTSKPSAHASSKVLSSDDKEMSAVFDQEKAPDKAQANSERNAIVHELMTGCHFSAQTVERLVQVFIDTTGSEFEELDYNSFLSLFNTRLPPTDQLEDDRVTRRIFSILDNDGSQGLNLKEFVWGIAIVCRPKNDDQFKFVFRVFDTDDDGLISKNELVRILKLNHQTIQSDEQAQEKAEEILRLAGNSELMTLEGFLRVKEKKMMLLTPVQERARKIAYLIASTDPK